MLARGSFNSIYLTKKREKLFSLFLIHKKQTRMKPFIIILFTLTTTVFCQDINWGKEQNGLQMGVAYEGDSLVIHLRNVTKNPIQLCRNLNTRSLEFYRL